MVVIDAHTHVTADGSWFETDYDASVSTLLAGMEEAGIDKALLLPVKGLIGSNELLADLCKQYPDRFLGFATVDPREGKAAERELTHFVKEQGLRGLKLHPRLQRLHPSDPGVVFILKCAAELSIPVLFDAWPYGNKGGIEYASPSHYDLLAQQVPEAKIIIAHAGGFRLHEAMAVAQSHPNVYLDISFIPVYYDGSVLSSEIGFVVSKMPQKIIYGSDFPVVSVQESYNRARTLLNDLSPEVQGRVFGDNLAELLRLEF